ncbi:DUF4129 domain-containing protein [Streptomyces zhihengii]
MLLLLLPLLLRIMARTRRLNALRAPAPPPPVPRARRAAGTPDGKQVTGTVTVPQDPAGTLAVWQEITDTAWDLGIVPDESLTPRRAAARLVTEGGLTDEPAAAVHRTARAVEEVLYAPTPGPSRAWPRTHG